MLTSIRGKSPNSGMRINIKQPPSQSLFQRRRCYDASTQPKRYIEFQET